LAAIDHARSRIDGLSNSKSYGRWTALLQDRASACQERRRQIEIPPELVENETDPQIESLLTRASKLIPTKGLRGFGDNQLDLVRQNLAGAQALLDRVRQLDPANARADGLQSQLDKGRKELKLRRERVDAAVAAQALAQAVHPPDPKPATVEQSVNSQKTEPVVLPTPSSGAKGTFCDPVTHKPLSPRPFQAVRRPDGQEFGGTIGANGEYSIPLEPGRYAFSFKDSEGHKRDAGTHLIQQGPVVTINPFPCK
jgi:hypothetical protein